MKNSSYIPYLATLNDRITHSETREVGSVFDTDNVRVFRERIGDIVDYSVLLEGLPERPEATLNVFDFDDTIYARYNQLQLPILQDNRGMLGNMVIENDIGMQNMLDLFYGDSGVVKRFMGVLEHQNHNHASMVLTAGEDSWQRGKCRTVGIQEQNVPIEVVSSSKDKPKKLLEYIIHTLRYKPGKIIVYEDRPEYFLETGEALSKMLGGVEIVVDKVVLSQEPIIKQIEKIEQTIFSPYTQLRNLR